MFGAAGRSLLRAAPPRVLPVARTAATRRYASTSPVDSRRSWKNSAVRWGIAIAGIYYYNTSPVFAEQPEHYLLNPNLDALDDSEANTTLETLTAPRKPRTAAPATSSVNASVAVAGEDVLGQGHESPADLEEEAASEGAFNPETGEINWDCPCLGGMAHGPCGPEFREAFSCFVYSAEEPKGMDCIDKFQNMQQCFQKYPEIYKGELEDDDELDAALEGERQDLANEIAERKAQLEDQDAPPPHRLLEEPAPTPVKPKRISKTSVPAKKQEEAAQPSDDSNSGEAEAKPTVSGTSDLSPERENITEGQKSKLTKEPVLPTVKEAGVPGDDVVPRQAYNATGSADDK